MALVEDLQSIPSTYLCQVAHNSTPSSKSKSTCTSHMAKPLHKHSHIHIITNNKINVWGIGK